MLGDIFAQKPKDPRDKLEDSSYMKDLSRRLSEQAGSDSYDVARLVQVARNIDQQKESDSRYFHSTHPESMGR